MCNRPQTNLPQALSEMSLKVNATLNKHKGNSDYKIRRLKKTKLITSSIPLQKGSKEILGNLLLKLLQARFGNGLQFTTFHGVPGTFAPGQGAKITSTPRTIASDIYSV